MANPETATSNHSIKWLGVSRQFQGWSVFLRVRKKGRNRYSESDKLPGHMKSYEHAAHEREDRNLF